MKAAMEADKARVSKDRSKDKNFGSQCEEALNRLLDAAQVASDWKVTCGKCSDSNPFNIKADPVLEDSCEDVVFAACDAK